MAAGKRDCMMNTRTDIKLIVVSFHIVRLVLEMDLNKSN
jgi:hypothetical protein